MTSSPVLRANVLGLCVLIALLMLVGGLTWERLAAARGARDETRHGDRTIATIEELDLAMRSAETGQRGYLLTGDETYLAPYDKALDRVGLLQGELQRLTAEDPGEQERIRALAPALQHKLEELAQTVELRRAGHLDAALAMVRTNAGRDLMVEIEARLALMTTHEEALLADRMETVERRGALVRDLATFGTVLALAGLLWAAWLLNRAWGGASRLEAQQRSLALRLRTCLDSLSQGLAVFDADQALAHWNGGFATFLALPSEVLRGGTPYADLVAATRRDGVSLLEPPDARPVGRQRPGEVVAYDRALDGARHLEFRQTAMPDGGFVLTIADMTQRAAAEAVLREAQKMQALGQLTGGIAHDFNNLLTVILGNLEVLRNKLGPDHAMQTRIGRGIWAAERGAALTRQLLAFARKQPLTPQPIDLQMVIPDLVPLLRHSLGETIEVRYAATPGAWPAMTDAAQVESALLNLALNARDAMPGGGRLTIETGNAVLDAAYGRREPDVTPGDYAMVAVTDSGHGMTPEILSRVFEPFFTTKPGGKGTGLGLAMVFGFAKQSGGHVEIVSAPGEGTTVRLYLPRAATGAGAAARDPVPLATPPRGAATVLVVEDEGAVREIACAMLADLGYRVLEAADGEEALRVFGVHAASVDLLLTDVVLPGELGGRDLAARITGLRPSVKVLFMSGYAESATVQGRRLAEGVDLISKPFNREQLAVMVAQVLGVAVARPPESAVVVPLRTGRES